MAWTMVFVAGLLEVLWAATMKASNGFTRLMPAVVTIVAMIASFALLSLSMRTLALGTAYVVWTGIGAIGTMVVGIAMYGEPATPVRIMAAVLILAGLLLLKLSTPP
jgi:quaternary ammonium compound-resistance protein SugE